MLPKDDRLSFSLQIVSADEQIQSVDVAKAQVQVEYNKLLKLDTANKNLFDPVNLLTNKYQDELTALDGNVRTTIIEQGIQDSANNKNQNPFYPNDETVSVPSLVASQNIWTKTKPFALGYGIGKSYQETYGTTTKEPDLITSILSLISSSSLYTDIQNTTGQQCGATGTCSLPAYTTQATCTANGGTWFPGPDAITTYAAVHTLKTNLVNAVNTLKSFLQNEVTLIATNDPDSSNQTQNNAAINNINNVIIPALNTWLAYPDFNTAHGQTTCVGFNSYNASLLAPTKLHSAQLTALQAAINSRSSFVTTRISQIGSVLGTISQDMNTGELVSSSGLYGKRYGFLVLRLNVLGGSLHSLTNMSNALNAQDSIKSSINNAKNTYGSVLKTSMLAAPSTGTNMVNVVDPSLFSVGDTVFIAAEGQEELQRAVKSISGKMITLNDIVPAKYRPSEKARIYKDLT